MRGNITEVELARLIITLRSLLQRCRTSGLAAIALKPKLSGLITSFCRKGLKSQSIVRLQKTYSSPSKIIRRGTGHQRASPRVNFNLLSAVNKNTPVAVVILIEQVVAALAKRNVHGIGVVIRQGYEWGIVIWNLRLFWPFLGFFGRRIGSSWSARNLSFSC